MVNLVSESHDVVRPDEDRGRCHTSGALFVEHEVGAWFEVLPKTRELKAQFADTDVRGIWALQCLGTRELEM